VFTGFAFAGMPLVAELGVACAVAIAVDATIVRLVLVPALMAMFDQWNWWLPAWLARILPSVDFEKPLPKVDLGDLVVIPDDISALVPPSGDLRMVVKGAARLKNLAPDAVSVADPLAFSGCNELAGKVKGSDDARAQPMRVGAGGTATVKLIRGYRSARMTAPRPVHPVTMWRGRLAIALDALETGADIADPSVERLSPVETTNVQLPTGDRLQIPTCAETLRMQAYLVLCRNSRSDFAEFADLVQVMDTEAAAVVLGGMDRYYCSGQSKRQWVTTQLVRRLADPNPSLATDDDRWAGPEGAAEWERIRQRCLAVAVAILEEAR
jgi:RND superfamily putative drug exporter